MIAPWPEDSYGRVKRLTFIASIWDDAVQDVLDVGCGTGSQLTKPLAQAYPSCRIIGIDSDSVSLAEASADNDCGNLEFLLSDALDPGLRFDLIIASEVLEHVDDPAAFLIWLRSRLKPRGRLVLTTPNGYGPFEWAQLIEACATMSGVWPMIRSAKRALFGGGNAQPSDTLAISPHVNFFSQKDLRTLFEQAGLTIDLSANRTFLCGFLLDQMVSLLHLSDWNARIADRLPSWLASDWMYGLGVVDQAKTSRPWSRGWWGEFRRMLNQRRWGMAGPSRNSRTRE